MRAPTSQTGRAARSVGRAASCSYESAAPTATAAAYAHARAIASAARRARVMSKPRRPREEPLAASDTALSRGAAVAGITAGVQRPAPSSSTAVLSSTRCPPPATSVTCANPATPSLRVCHLRPAASAHVAHGLPVGQLLNPLTPARTRHLLSVYERRSPCARPALLELGRGRREAASNSAISGLVGYSARALETATLRWGPSTLAARSSHACQSSRSIAIAFRKLARAAACSPCSSWASPSAFSGSGDQGIQLRAVVAAAAASG